MTWPHALLLLLAVLLICTPLERDGWKRRSLSSSVPRLPGQTAGMANAEVSVAHPGTDELSDR